MESIPSSFRTLPKALRRTIKTSQELRMFKKKWESREKYELKKVDLDIVDLGKSWSL